MENLTNYSLFYLRFPGVRTKPGYATSPSYNLSQSTLKGALL